ncbi:hypothetical protein HYW18_01280 [Candidatus Uhrbacteria bacterium]|nr:hypothetical protein [Candidatus Uhrbacteria bacterium]
MLLDAKDILFIVLAFCALWFTAFACWLIYQLAVFLKNVNDTVSDVRGSVAKLEQAVSGIRNRFDHATSGMMLALEAGKKIVDMLATRREEKKVKKKK